MAIELFNDGKHICLAFSDLVAGESDKDGGAVQANQFLIVDNGHGAVIDPGGNMTYNALIVAMNRYFSPQNLDYILASHADPDIVASANKWMVGTEAKIVISSLWARFVPHFCTAGKTEGRVIPIPDEGMEIPLGQMRIRAIPAHFLHAEGNFHFYDPVSKVLFSGDVGASFVDYRTIAQPVSDFDSHVPNMEAFHRRIMNSNRVARFWVNMIRGLDVEWMVPQHGRSFRGKAMVKRFLDWFETLPCGVDLMTQDNYRLPRNPD